MAFGKCLHLHVRVVEYYARENATPVSFIFQPILKTFACKSFSFKLILYNQFGTINYSTHSLLRVSTLKLEN